jgi:hypothetical protein
MASGAAGTGSASSEVAVVLDRTSELEELVRRASWLGRDTADHALASFTSIFLAFLVSRDPLSRWVQDKVSALGPARREVLRRWKSRWRTSRSLDERELEAARTAALDRVEVATTPSADELVDRARGVARRVGADRLDVRHLFAVYLYEPPGHADDLAAWKLDREAWATRFRCHVAAAHPEEAARWRELHDEVFARDPSIGVTEVLRWASVVATEAGRSTLDARSVFHGILLDGMRYAADRVTSSQLVDCLGGARTIQPLVTPSTTSGTAGRPLAYDHEVCPIIDRALVFATATGAEGTRGEGAELRRLHVRHLVAAFLTDRRPLAVFAILRQAQRTQAGVLAQVRRTIGELSTPNDDLARWGQIFDEYREDVFAGYDNDEAHGDDRLEIDTDVDALAGVLASTQVVPPLSVGLFGDWGSGKSFFMKQLCDKITRLSAAAKARPDGESWLVGQRGHVVQIEFNAWHYMDADLWSSLAVRVFDELSERFEAEFAEACAKRLTSIKDQQDALEAEKTKVEASASTLDEQIASLQKQRAEAEVPLVTYVRELAVAVAEDPQVVLAAKELRIEGETAATELNDVKRDLSTVGGTAARVWRAWRSPTKVLVLALVIGLPAIAAVVAGSIDRVAEWASGATAVIASVLAVIAAVRKSAVRLTGIANKALDRIEKIEEEARGKKTAREQEAEAARARFTAQIADLERAQLQLSKQKADLEAQIKRLEKPDKRTLQEFILQRAAADDYRKKLGVVSAVHQDFLELSRFLQPNGEKPNVERIILYIDDLDRCSPEQVVQVLQAIHVILSLPLFVVVVAVDSCWLLDSLTAYYRKQFPGADVDASRPQQYLEKIFQIPFTLLPMSAAGYEALSGSLLERNVDLDEVGEAPVIVAHQPQTHETLRAGGPSRPTAPAPAPRRVAPSNQVELTPRGLRLEPAEAAFLRKLTGLVASPRATKRLVNLYRIVRSTLDDVALDQLISGGYRVTQIWLALVVGHPALAADLFDAILAHRVASREELVAWCGEREARAKPSELRLRAALGQILNRRDEFADWRAARAAVRRVARFSFETGRVLGYYVDEAA